MSHNLLTKWLAPRQSCKRQGQHRRPAALSRRYPQLLERLEDDTAPSIVTPSAIRFSADVTGAMSGLASTLETASTVNNPRRTQPDVLDAENGVGPSADSPVARAVFQKPWSAPCLTSAEREHP